MAKCVLIYRLPNETKTAGGLFIPGTAEQKKPQGILLAAGLAARDILKDALIELGDIIWFAIYAGWEASVEKDPGNKDKQMVQIKAEDILGSEDALERMKNHRIAYDEKLGEHYYEEVAHGN
jgi:chaperonin GroES